MLFERGWERRRLFGQLTWFISWFLITSLAVILTPSSKGHGTHTQLGLPPCPSVILYGRPCPGCGLTTSFTALAHGDIPSSFQANLFGPIFYVLFTLSACACAYGYLKKQRFVYDSRWLNRFMMCLTLSFLAFGAWRFTQIKYEPGLADFSKLRAIR